MTAKNTKIHTVKDGQLSIGVHDDGTQRWLEFGDGAIQSLIDRQHPRNLVSPVNQAMLAALMFTPPPNHFLLLGLGGGAIARYLSHRLPECQGDAVELSPAVINIARHFFDFPVNNWQIHPADVRDFVSPSGPDNPGTLYDYMVLDIAEQQHTPRWLTDPCFLGHCQQRLSRQGVLCINLAPTDADDFKHHLAQIRQAFPTRTFCLSVPEHRNILVFAFAQRPEFEDIAELRHRLRALSDHWELPFTDDLNRMLQENPSGSGVF